MALIKKDKIGIETENLKGVERPSIDDKIEVAPIRRKVESGHEEPRTGRSFETEEGEGSREVAGVSSAHSASYVLKEREKAVEKVLSSNLEEIYKNMPADKQREFKVEGEKTAKEINSLLSKTKLKVKKIVALIKQWLAIIPGVNKFFLEQESKIKTDEIIKLKNKL